MLEGVIQWNNGTKKTITKRKRISKQEESGLHCSVVVDASQVFYLEYNKLLEITLS